MKPMSLFGLPFGISSIVWLIIGLLRFVSERFFHMRPRRFGFWTTYRPSDIAVIIAAHNEEVGIVGTIKSITRTLRPRQIYVASDGSTDKTADKAHLTGCHVVALTPGRGKARALKYLMTKYRLLYRYKLIFICDADTRIDHMFIKRALTYFDDAEIAVVFAGTKIVWPKHILPRLGWYFISYRDRLNRLLVFFYMYAQTWKYTNVTYVIPGSCVIYRSDVLSKLPIDTPGLLTEDFNTAFQIHRQRLGKVAYHPSLIERAHYPDNFVDYWKQVRRWNIGFLQTVRKNGIWPSMFWVTLGVFTLEVWLNAFFILLLPLMLLPSILPQFTSWHIPFSTLSLQYIFLTFFLWDYFVTVIVAIQQRKPQMLFYGLFFFIMHYATVLILLSSFIPGFLMSSNGRWISPTRRRGA